MIYRWTFLERFDNYTVEKPQHNFSIDNAVILMSFDTHFVTKVFILLVFLKLVYHDTHKQKSATL